MGQQPSIKSRARSALARERRDLASQNALTVPRRVANQVIGAVDEADRETDGALGIAAGVASMVVPEVQLGLSAVRVGNELLQTGDIQQDHLVREFENNIPGVGSLRTIDKVAGKAGVPANVRRATLGRAENLADQVVGAMTPNVSSIIHDPLNVQNDIVQSLKPAFGGQAFIARNAIEQARRGAPMFGRGIGTAAEGLLGFTDTAARTGADFFNERMAGGGANSSGQKRKAIDDPMKERAYDNISKKAKHRGYARMFGQLAPIHSAHHGHTGVPTFDHHERFNHNVCVNNERALCANGIGSATESDMQARRYLQDHNYHTDPWDHPAIKAHEEMGAPDMPLTAEEVASKPDHIGSAVFTPYQVSAANDFRIHQERHVNSGLRDTSHHTPIALGSDHLNPKYEKNLWSQGYVPYLNQHGQRYNPIDHGGPNAPSVNPFATAPDIANPAIHQRVEQRDTAETLEKINRGLYAGLGTATQVGGVYLLYKAYQQGQIAAEMLERGIRAAYRAGEAGAQRVYAAAQEAGNAAAQNAQDVYQAGIEAAERLPQQAEAAVGEVDAAAEDIEGMMGQLFGGGDEAAVGEMVEGNAARDAVGMAGDEALVEGAVEPIPLQNFNFIQRLQDLFGMGGDEEGEIMEGGLEGQEVAAVDEIVDNAAAAQMDGAAAAVADGEAMGAAGGLVEAGAGAETVAEGATLAAEIGEGLAEAAVIAEEILPIAIMVAGAPVGI